MEEDKALVDLCEDIKAFKAFILEQDEPTISKLRGTYYEDDIGYFLKTLEELNLIIEERDRIKEIYKTVCYELNKVHNRCTKHMEYLKAACIN